jgi:hypothetical protein
MLHEVDRLDTKGIEKIQFLFVFDFALQGLGGKGAPVESETAVGIGVARLLVSAG